MIKATPAGNNTIRLEIKMHIPTEDMINFLYSKGYEITRYVWISPAKDEMLLSEPRTEHHTFTATRDGAEPTKDDDYIKVFEKEIKEFLKGL
ncbi:hypothetical protein [Elizabethkingia anophelis]|uniref:hypothetical protein n=1 Tax=Elizabethkingia anophelis TaxID=1117645 RepID=UPI0013182245|nr:hypothetical protein [Elizabethkingia anophelis]MBE9393710.1 hypothetical protein [Elizabethkingia anophelis]MBE9405689.1 hypothetical protein [Elizabethkingia anophelis]BBQ07556.1 hypothetical protein JUNP353_2127 [Elizabethkingia anophelis]